LSDQTSGAFIATITNLLIPAKYMLTQNNTVVKKGFVFNDKAKKTEYTDVEYTIESVDASMMDVLVDDDENEKYVGILRCTMTEKK
jgi:formylmethanofuran dehydrogenase subunit A